MEVIDQLIMVAKQHSGCFFYFDVLVIVIDENGTAELPDDYWSTGFKNPKHWPHRVDSEPVEQSDTTCPRMVFVGNVLHCDL